MKFIALQGFLLLSFCAPAIAEIQSISLTYESDGLEMQGELFYDDSSSEKRPGILVVHEWWGLNQHAKDSAKKLAELGYSAMAIDMYGSGKQAAHPGDAGKFSSEALSDFPRARRRFEAALQQLKSHSSIDPQKIAAIGYCFGGSVVLNMARAGMDLKGVVSIHGSLSPAVKSTQGDVKASILVCNGAADSFISSEQIAAFKQEMNDAKVDYTFVNYEGAKHSFSNPGADELAQKFGLGIAYNKAAAEKSWGDMQVFLKKIF